MVDAILAMRKRLTLRQADLAERLGCKQNTISKYELGKAHPDMKLLVKLWRLADAGERALIQKHLSSELFLEDAEQQMAFAEGILSLPDRPFSVEIAAVLTRPDAPNFLRVIVSLYLRFGNSAGAARLFEQAASWLQVQFQMLDYAKKTGFDPSLVSTDDYVGRLLKEAADEPLIREQEPRKS